MPLHCPYTRPDIFCKPLAANHGWCRNAYADIHVNLYVGANAALVYFVNSLKNNIFYQSLGIIHSLIGCMNTIIEEARKNFLIQSDKAINQWAAKSREGLAHPW